MHLHVATQAGLALRYCRRVPPPGNCACRFGSVRQCGLYRPMPRVTGIAQEGGPRLEHALGGCAVGVVAGRAIFADRLVVMHEGAALFHVAGVAGVVHPDPLHQFRTG